VSSWGLEISDALTVVLAGICVGVEDTFVDTGLADAFEGVAIEVTFSGRAAEDGGGIITEQWRKRTLSIKTTFINQNRMPTESQVHNLRRVRIKDT
jgi:hypothetical protein